MKEKLNNWLRRITLRQLRGFASVIDEGGVSAAARALHVSPPAVSLQLRDLENAIGVPLFERSKQGMQPTTAGAALLEL